MIWISRWLVLFMLYFLVFVRFCWYQRSDGWTSWPCDDLQCLPWQQATYNASWCSRSVPSYQHCQLHHKYPKGKLVFLPLKMCNFIDFHSIFSSADYSQAELIWYKSVRRPASGVRRPSEYVNFFKLLLLLHFSMDSFETRYTYFLGQSPNFVLFRILKFGFSAFLWIFIKIHWNCYFSYIFQSILLKLGTLVSWVSPQTLFFSEFWNLDFLIFYEFSSNFHWNRYCSYNFQWFKLLLLLHFPMDSFETRYTYFLGQSLNFVLFRILKFGFSDFFMNFHQNSLKLLLLLHFPIDSFETRYTCFLGQSPNFVLFGILKFGFSDFLWIFIKFSLKSLLLLQFPVVQIATSPTFSNGFFWN